MCAAQPIINSKKQVGPSQISSPVNIKISHTCQTKIFKKKYKETKSTSKVHNYTVITNDVDVKGDKDGYMWNTSHKTG